MNTTRTLFLSLLFASMTLWQSSSCGKSEAQKNNNSAKPAATANTNSMSNNSTQTSNEMAKGIWGGLHINLEVTDTGATIDYDCAHGSIEGKVVVDREGKFEAKGFHVREGPGPIRVGREPKGQPAIYSGTTDGKNLELTVKLADSEEVIGTFNLTKGQTGRVRKCK